MAVDTKAPERIYLQDDGDFEAAREPDLTWCEDRINDGDTEYVRADLHAALRKRYEEAIEALDEIRSMRPREFEFPDDWSEQVRACLNCARYKGHPIQQGICDEHRRPLWDRVQFDAREREALGSRMREVACALIERHKEAPPLDYMPSGV